MPKKTLSVGVVSFMAFWLTFGGSFMYAEPEATTQDAVVATTSELDVIVDDTSTITGDIMVTATELSGSIENNSGDVLDTGVINPIGSGSTEIESTIFSGISEIISEEQSADPIMTGNISLKNIFAISDQSSSDMPVDENAGLNTNPYGSAIRLMAVSTVPNPIMTKACGTQTKIVLVLDSSDSMDDGDISTVKSAAKTLATDLISGNLIGVIDFDTNVISSLSPTNNITNVNNAINSIGHTNQTEYTNREAALSTANGMAGSGDLVVIITDGNPTRSNGPGTDLDDAITAANGVKNGGTRILAIGINSNGGLNADNLKKISGNQVVSGSFTDINAVDVYMGNISTLSTVLANLAAALNTYYFDADGDGYGDSSIFINACTAPNPNYVTANGDCNDVSTGTNPGAIDIPNDGIDQNCDGSDFITDVTAPVVTLNGSGLITLTIGDIYSEDGATWTDDFDGSGTLLAAAYGTVDTSSSGTYTLQYIYTDLAGNTGNVVTRTIVVAPAPVDGGWSDRSIQDPSCGVTGTQTRTCTNPAPANGGTDCVGSSTQTYTNPACPIDGGRGDRSIKDPSCGVIGTQTRTCTNPAPANGGADCVGSSTQTYTNPACPTIIDGGWSDRSEKTNSCGAIGIQTRTCTNPAPANGGADCVGPSTQLYTNPPCFTPVNGGRSDRSLQDPSCGITGTQTRTCTNPAPANGGADCVGSSTQTYANPACPVPVNGGRSARSSKDTTCGIVGVQTRTCTNPAPANGGTDCLGVNEQSYTNNACTPPPTGGGPTEGPTRDNCPSGDYSPSYYDGSCGTPPIVVVIPDPEPTPVDEIIPPETPIEPTHERVNDNQPETRHQFVYPVQYLDGLRAAIASSGITGDTVVLPSKLLTTGSSKLSKFLAGTGIELISLFLALLLLLLLLLLFLRRRRKKDEDEDQKNKGKEKLSK